MSPAEKFSLIEGRAFQLFSHALAGDKVEYVAGTPVMPLGTSDYIPLHKWAMDQAKATYKFWNAIPGNEDK